MEPAVKPHSRHLAVSSLFLLVLVLAAVGQAFQPDRPKSQAGKPDLQPSEPPAPRVVGTVIFPPRSNVQRVSSALELFAVEVANPSAKPGQKATINAGEMTSKALDFIRRSQQ